ncbi:MAG: NFACT family protein [Thaumarchaeota archaeon]|nr:NFACT family protein [Nitrososphaerota archaeon]
MLAKEINSALAGAYVNNIYSLGRAQIIRFRKPGGVDVWLVASPEHGVWVSDRVSERAETSPFTSKLRSHFERARFVDASQPDLDRIFVLTLMQRDSPKRLIVEMMPPGNVLVADEGGLIELAEAEVRTAGRRVVKGSTYSIPAPKRSSPATVTAADVSKAIAGEKTAGRAIGRRVALPGKYVREVLGRLSVREDEPASALLGREEDVARVMVDLVDEARSNPSPCLAETPAGAEIFAVRPTSAEVTERAESLSALCDRLLLGRAVQGVSAPPDKDEVARKELEVSISRLRETQKSLTEEAERIREMADQAGAAASIESALELLKSSGVEPRGVPRSRAAVASVIYDAAKARKLTAQQAGQAADRLERKLPKAKERKARPTKEIRKRKGEWYEKFRWFVTTGGRLAIGGRDAQSNTILVRRHLDANDVVYHADLFGSPFFILKGGKEQTEEEVKEVAQATASFSSAWKTGLGVADAYWVKPDQIGTSAPSGEYLAKGSFLVKGKRNHVSRNIVEIAVGVEAGGRIFSGPEKAVASRSVGYVVLRPHREKGSDTAKKVRKDLQGLAGERDDWAVSLEDVMRSLPAGGGKVVRKKSVAPD